MGPRRPTEIPFVFPRAACVAGARRRSRWHGAGAPPELDPCWLLGPAAGQLHTCRRSSGAEQPNDEFDDFQHLLLGFTAVDRRGYNPLAAGVEQLFKDVVEGIAWRNLLGGQAEPSAITLGSQRITAADGIA